MKENVIPGRDKDWQGKKYAEMDRFYTAKIEIDRHTDTRLLDGTPVQYCKSTASCIRLTFTRGGRKAFLRLDPEGVVSWAVAQGFDAIGLDDREMLIEAIRQMHPDEADRLLFAKLQWFAANEGKFTDIFSNGAFQNVRSVEEMIEIIFSLGRAVEIGGNIGLMTKIAIKPSREYAWRDYKNGALIQSNDYFVIAELDDSRPAVEIEGCNMKRRTFSLPYVDAIINFAKIFGLKTEMAVLFESGTGFHYAYLKLRKTQAI